jgi:hypothetical protein
VTPRSSMALRHSSMWVRLALGRRDRVDAPLEEGTQVVAVDLEGPAALPGQVRGCGHLGPRERTCITSAPIGTELGVGGGHDYLPCFEEDSEHLCSRQCQGRPWPAFGHEVARTVRRLCR